MNSVMQAASTPLASGPLEPQSEPSTLPRPRRGIENARRLQHGARIEPERAVASGSWPERRGAERQGQQSGSRSGRTLVPWRYTSRRVATRR